MYHSIWAPLGFLQIECACQFNKVIQANESKCKQKLSSKEQTPCLSAVIIIFFCQMLNNIDRKWNFFLIKQHILCRLIVIMGINKLADNQYQLNY